MWYNNKSIRQAQGIGGGVIKPLPNDFARPIDPSVKQKQVWDILVNSSDHIGNQKGTPNITETDDAPLNEGPATQADEMRRLSPLHSNPEDTTYEERLEAVRHQNVNKNPNESINSTNMAQTNAGQGAMAIKGLPQYNQGKGAGVFDNDNKSSTQTFAK